MGIRSLLLHGHHHRATATAHVALDRRGCEACWECIDVCPKGVLGKVEMGRHRHAVVIAPDDCTGCLACVRACEAGALTGIAATSS